MRRNQREVMRDLFRQYGRDRDRVVSAYAAAERSGIVPRQSNLRGISAEEYASRLFSDGMKKAWLG